MIELEFIVYEILEGVRVTSGYLRDHETSKERRRSWNTVHREVGLAGYHASAQLQPIHRQRAATLALETSPEPTPWWVENALWICDVIELIPDLVDEIRGLDDARDHALEASERLCSGERDERAGVLERDSVVVDAGDMQAPVIDRDNLARYGVQLPRERVPERDLGPG